MRFRSRGFTLIELLVVIAIIGVLSTIVLAALNQSRSKGLDSAIKRQLSQIRAYSELLYDSTGTRACYPGSMGGPCAGSAMTANSCNNAPASTLFVEPSVNKMIIAAAISSGASDISGASCVSGPSQNAWAVSVPLRSTPTDSWCVDSTGNSKKVTPDTGLGDRGFNGNKCK